MVSYLYQFKKKRVCNNCFNKLGNVFCSPAKVVLNNIPSILLLQNYDSLKIIKNEVKFLGPSPIKDALMSEAIDLLKI